MTILTARRSDREEDPGAFRALPLAMLYTVSESLLSRTMRSAIAALLMLALPFAGSGCATRGPLACPSSQADSRSVKVFYATDRKRASGPGTWTFGGERTDPPGINLGSERVLLGPGHRIGTVDAAVRITPAHGHPAAQRDTRSAALQRTDAQIAAFADSELRAAIRSAPPPHAGGRRKVLVFIHGFNTTFDYALRKTAQLAGDLDLVNCAGETRGVAVAYSWPARGKLLSYLADEENAEWTQQRLAPFLQSLSRVCREERADLCLVAHSMGARALVRSLADLASAGSSRERIADQVVLLAPDIGKGLFDQYVERLLPLVGHLTIYVSARDRALSLSTLLHGGHQRLGLLETTVFAALELAGLHRGGHRELGSVPVTPGSRGKTDMIDVSHSMASQFGHTYEAPEFIHDLRGLICHSTPAATGGRGLLQRGEIPRDSFRERIETGLTYFRLKSR